MELDIYTLAHEIKNPLSIAKGYLEMSNEGTFEKYKELIDNNIKEALNILDNYLEYRKMSLEYEIVDIFLLLEEIKNNYFQLYNIEINIMGIYDELFINCDYCKIKQVFNNLIKNSIEANSKKINIFLKIHNKDLIINIIDDGDGFNNCDSLEGYTSKISGNGIGLLLTKKILNMHGGGLIYNNNEENGCNISINLPINL